MNGAGYQLLAGSGLTKNENGCITGSNLFHLIEHIFKPVTLPDNVLIVVFQFYSRIFQWESGHMKHTRESTAIMSG